jgi:hypothetical protein
LHSLRSPGQALWRSRGRPLLGGRSRLIAKRRTEKSAVAVLIIGRRELPARIKELVLCTSWRTKNARHAASQEKHRYVYANKDTPHFLNSVLNRIASRTRERSVSRLEA